MLEKWAVIGPSAAVVEQVREDWSFMCIRHRADIHVGVFTPKYRALIGARSTATIRPYAISIFVDQELTRKARNREIARQFEMALRYRREREISAKLLDFNRRAQ